MIEEEAAERFVRWLEKRLVLSARGDEHDRLEVQPSGRFWLGRLAPEATVAERALGERGERLDPCACGMRLRPSEPGPWQFEVRATARAWVRDDASGNWDKTEPVDLVVPIEITESECVRACGSEAFCVAWEEVGAPGLQTEIRIEIETRENGEYELTILMVNTSPPESRLLKDTNLYECRLTVRGLATSPYRLEALPDSFRYDRTVPAYGINSGVEVSENADRGVLRTTDGFGAERKRPLYWPFSTEKPDLSFERLSEDPLPPLRALNQALKEWGNEAWGSQKLDARAKSEGWSREMREEAEQEAAKFREESHRVESGVELLEKNDTLNRSFRLMNRTMTHSTAGKYREWRPFQVGFILANLACVVCPEDEVDIVEIVWFATGGGKTETYLALLLAAAFHDRLTDKRAGITAWSRFPLRMLSLQQTQRFADALCAAELVRREEKIPGEPFSVGFLVGNTATPNRIQDTDDPKYKGPDPDDEGMPERYQVLSHCPFCHRQSIRMAFERRNWRLEHRCINPECLWPENSIPFYIVDEEIYRFLPTVLVGTLDKAASIAIQSGMRGLVGAPYGKCQQEGHGYTYAPRRDRPHGCLVPGCTARAAPLDMDESRFPPSFRLQDELHLLKDSLGAVDAHYEAILDALESELAGRRPKILASSATLAGYERQVEVLYGRRARVFPSSPPVAGEGFWTTDSNTLMRRYLAIPPRGVTMEYAIDRILTELQAHIRRLLAEPHAVCEDAGIDPRHAEWLRSIYGTNVAYGNTLRDIDAVMRSAETQLHVEGTVNITSLTGRTDFGEVRKILKRLEDPEHNFEERLHVIGASSMMSHGVDVDRLNVMAMLGLPLTTSEFVQATARVGRRWPGLVLVVPKIARERDAGVFRAFPKFIEQAERFLEPIPISRRSIRVLERTLPGLVLARLTQVHEPRSGTALTTVPKLREYLRTDGYQPAEEAGVIVEALGFSKDHDERLLRYLDWWMEQFVRNIQDPGDRGRFPSDMSPCGRPMWSLRDVEEQVPVWGSYES